MEKKLSVKQQKFVDCYNGNATEAAIKAGYSKKTARQIGQENLTKPYIFGLIKERQGKEQKKGIMSRQERQLFWSNTIRDTSIEIQHRLKASELLGKSEADFIDNVKTNIQEMPKIVVEFVGGDK